MNGPPTSPRVMLFYLVSKGRIFGIEKGYAIYLSKKRHLFKIFYKQGGLCPRGPLAPAALVTLVYLGQRVFTVLSESRNGIRNT